MHIITIKEHDTGLFDVLLNGHSYRIHRGLSESAAIERADLMKEQFRTMRQRAVIERV